MNVYHMRTNVYCLSRRESGIVVAKSAEDRRR